MLPLLQLTTTGDTIADVPCTTAATTATTTTIFTIDVAATTTAATFN